MIRLILAAGVASLAITAPVASAPRNKDGQTTEAKQDRSAQRTQRVQQRTERASRRTERVAAAQRPQRSERVQARTERQRVRAERPARVERQQQVRANRVERVQTRVAERPARVERQQQVRANRVEQAQSRQVERQQMRADRQARTQTLQADRQQMRADRQAQAQDLRVERIKLRPDRVAQVRRLAADRAAIRPLRTFGTRVLPVTTARTLVGVPVTTAATVAAFSPLPSTVQFLYPDTPDYYYRYGDGYLYQVDRSSNLIAALLPLLAGGFMPGQYLPNYYMNSSVPNYYGFNSFYPNSRNDCYRYGDGVVFKVNCFTGLIEEVIPLYAGGYGVGQMLPSAYSYYNVPSQYRSLYYNTSDYGYRYAPGAIYQYDPSSSLITSVAALLSPGFSVGQPLPLGYSAYNVPYGYRSTYFDTPNAWYRYNNGSIYQVDPSTLLVTALVASALT